MEPWTDSTVAVRKRTLDADDIAFAQRKHSRGYPASAIAKMMGRSVVDVRPLLPAAPEREPPAVIAPPDPPKAVQFPDVMAKVGVAVAWEHELTLADLRGRSRCRPVAQARQDLCWRLYQLKHPDGQRRFSTPQIAKFVGLLDHTSVLHAIRAHEARQAGE